MRWLGENENFKLVIEKKEEIHINCNDLNFINSYNLKGNYET